MWAFVQSGKHMELQEYVLYVSNKQPSLQYILRNVVQYSTPAMRKYVYSQHKYSLSRTGQLQ